MTVKVSEERWRQAQSPEFACWRRDVGDPAEFGKTLAGKLSARACYATCGPSTLESSGPFVEVGIGPMAIGLAHMA